MNSVLLFLIGLIVIWYGATHVPVALKDRRQRMVHPSDCWRKGWDVERGILSHAALILIGGIIAAVGLVGWEFLHHEITKEGQMPGPIGAVLLFAGVFISLIATRRVTIHNYLKTLTKDERESFAAYRKRRLG